jgi:sugar phosphate isomerase/epimerase
MKTTLPLSRREFLAATAAAPLAASVAFAQSKRIPIGIELYTVRGELQKDLPATVRAVAKMGYQVVEFYAPYFSWTTEQAKDVRKLMDDVGVKCHSTHNGAAAITGDGINKAIELNQIIGSRYIIVSSPPPKTVGAEGWKAFGDLLTAAMEKLRPLKMATGFHNHQTEWKPFEDGKRPMDVLAASTPKDVALQLDAGTVVEAGNDPVAWIKANPGRIKSVHLKDWSKDKGGYAIAFGEGDVPWKALFQAAESTGGVEYYLIEQERAGDDGELAMAKKCLENYRRMQK